MDVGLWTTGIMLSGATNPTLMANTAPLWVGLGSWLIFKEKQSPKFWLGLVLAMFGAGLVLVNDLSRATQVGIGTFLGLLAGVFYGGYFLVTQRGRVHLNTMTYFWIATLSSAVFLLVVNLLIKQPLRGYPASTYIYFLLMGVVVQVIGWLAINYAQGFLPASIVSPTMLGQPVLTALFASLLIGETFSFQQVVGGVIVIMGVYIVHHSGWQNRNAPPEKVIP
jgi:drug/metabolite transporter (DMT)-like permease